MPKGFKKAITLAMTAVNTRSERQDLLSTKLLNN
jgi:hypothetical protein